MDEKEPESIYEINSRYTLHEKKGHLSIGTQAKEKVTVEFTALQRKEKDKKFKEESRNS